jgi:hypothetical protein
MRFMNFMVKAPGERIVTRAIHVQLLLAGTYRAIPAANP